MKKIKLLLATGLLLMIFSSRGEDISVEVNPPEPLMGESFYVTFKIKTSSNVDPYITFTPVNLEVKGRSEQGVSIFTTVVNGKFSTVREQNYVYELIADHQGTAFLRNVKVDMSGKVSTLKDININVLAQARKIPDVFMEAITSKSKVYIGEALDVNYYLYFKTRIMASDVKEFPKLNKFIKRFDRKNSAPETVQYRGQIFKRSLVYSAKLFPEKVGRASLDPMVISLQIVESDFSSPFSAFGMRGDRYKNKDISSPRVEIEVLPLPTENVPPGFTGLVGEHDFSLSISKSKYLVNEPIEIKFIATGKGALENMDAPVLYSDNTLEQFDTKSEISEAVNQQSKKVFEYTYLARGPLSLKPRELSLAYFDPTSGKYIEKKVEVPGLEVSGVATSSPIVSPADQNNISEKNTKIINPAPLGLVGPSMKGEARWFDRWLDILNIVLSIVIFSIGLRWYFQNKDTLPLSGSAKEVSKLIHEAKKKGLTYSNLYKIVSFLDKENNMGHKGISIFQVIDESELSKDAKTYFNTSLLICEEKSFGIDKNDKKCDFENKYFREILKFV